MKQKLCVALRDLGCFLTRRYAFHNNFKPYLNNVSSILSMQVFFVFVYLQLFTNICYFGNICGSNKILLKMIVLYPMLICFIFILLLVFLKSYLKSYFYLSLFLKSQSIRPSIIFGNIHLHAMLYLVLI